MTPDEFRNLALSLPEAVEGAHMDHPDFRIGGKIFATLWPDDKWAMVKLSPEQQAAFVRADPKMFEIIHGSWGARGATKVLLPRAKERMVRRALSAAWRNTAPKKIIREFGDDVPE
jgi:hypothetical protein